MKTDWVIHLQCTFLDNPSLGIVNVKANADQHLRTNTDSRSLPLQSKFLNYSRVHYGSSIYIMIVRNTVYNRHSSSLWLISGHANCFVTSKRACNDQSGTLVTSHALFIDVLYPNTVLWAVTGESAAYHSPVSAGRSGAAEHTCSVYITRAGRDALYCTPDRLNLLARCMVALDGHFL